MWAWVGGLCLLLAAALVYWWRKHNDENIDIPSIEDYIQKDHTSKYKVDFSEMKLEFEALRDADEDSFDLAKTKGALTKRAMKCLERVWELNSERTQIQQLHTQNFLPPGVFAAFTDAIRASEAEMMEIRDEAEALMPSWGESIFQQAKDFVVHQKRKEYVAAGRAKMEKDKKVAEAAEQKRRKLEEIQSKQQLEKASKTADRLAEQLIREEESKKPKGAARKRK